MSKRGRKRKDRRKKAANHGKRPGRYYSESRISNRKIKNPAIRVLKVNWYEPGF